jgi:hypothetical protein
MDDSAGKLRPSRTWITALAAAGTAAMLGVSAAQADDAKGMFKAMSDYLGSQNAISFDYDSNLEVVTTQNQKLGLASSGTLALNRPDKVRATRTGGFADIALGFDGKTLTLLGKNLNIYAQADVPGSIDHLVDELRDKFHRPVPAADLLMANPYDQLMPLVSGVIGGVECDHLAFRTKQVDWQIWMTQGANPHPCRYVITTKDVPGSPQYTIDVRAWKTGADVAPGALTLDIPKDAKKVELSGLTDFDELGGIFKVKGGQ